MNNATEKRITPTEIKRLRKERNLRWLECLEAEAALKKAQVKLDEATKKSPCETCQEIEGKYNGFGPSHDGRSTCRSGSIASGGKNAHCTCGACF